MIIIYSEKILAEALKEATEIINELQLEYDLIEDNIIEAIEQFVRTLDEVSLVEAQKNMSPAELLQFKRKISYYLTDDISESWEKELKSYEDRKRVKRLESVVVAIKHELDRIGTLEKERITELTDNTYRYTYYNTLYEISKDMGVTKLYNKVDDEVIENLHNEPWADDNKNRETRIDERLTIASAFLLKRFVQTVKTGDINPLYESVGKRVRYNKYRVKGLCVTETVYYNSNAQEDAYNEVGIEEYQNIATLDDRTSEICQEMDLTVFPVSEYEPGVTAPPFHTYCRTVTIHKYDDNFVERFARDGDRIYYVDGDISYKEWYENYVK